MRKLQLLSAIAICLPLCSANSSPITPIDVGNYPFMVRLKTRLESTNAEECALANRKALEQSISQKEAIVLGGQNNIITTVEKSECFANFVLVSQGEIQQQNFRSRFAENRLSIAAWVDTARATFLGLAASGNRLDGSYFNCERRGVNNLSVTNWYAGLMELDRGLAKVKALDISGRISWINQEFDCGQIELLSSIDIVFDVTNTPACPLSATTVNSCFVLRGLKKFTLNLRSY